MCKWNWPECWEDVKTDSGNNSAWTKLFFLNLQQKKNHVIERVSRDFIMYSAPNQNCSVTVKRAGFQEAASAQNPLLDQRDYCANWGAFRITLQSDLHNFFT